MYNDRSIGMEIKHTVLIHRFQYEKVDDGKKYKNSRFANMLYEKLDVTLFLHAITTPLFFGRPQDGKRADLSFPPTGDSLFCILPKQKISVQKKEEKK